MRMLRSLMGGHAGGGFKARWGLMLFPLVGGLLLAGEASAAERPNVLLITADQMRGDALSAVGHPAVETPTLDGLAKDGALFRRAYAEVPSCIPTRYAMLTGMSPQASGVVGYTGTRVTRPTMPQTFREAGYKTALVGRTMHQKTPDDELGYEDWIQGSVFVGYGRNKDYERFLKDKLPPDTELGETLHEEGLRSMVTSMGVTYNAWQAAPWPLNDAWHPTAWTARRAEQWVEREKGDRPIFLTTSFYAPHSPLFPPTEYFEKYRSMELPEPAKGDWVDWDAVTPEGRLSNTRVLLRGERLRRAQAGYFGLIEHIDHELASLIEAFKKRSRRSGRPWVVVFTSEHGEMLGDHGYYRKCEPYEGSANIPYIIAGSEALGFEAGVRSKEPVGTQDLFPTLADLAGIDPPDQVTGVSLVPTLRGKDQEVRPWLHFEHHPTYSDSQAFHALTDGRYKYIWRPLDGGKEQLFDLKNDPKEEHNLADDPEHQALLKKWRNRLIERLADRPEGFSNGEKLIPGRPYKAHMPGKTP